MRATKHQLRRIIKEEKTNLLHEVMTPMMEDFVEQLVGEFEEDMLLQFEETPEGLETDYDEFEPQVVAAGNEYRKLLTSAMSSARDQVESALQHGAFLR